VSPLHFLKNFIVLVYSTKIAAAALLVVLLQEPLQVPDQLVIGKVLEAVALDRGECVFWAASQAAYAGEGNPLLRL
jgi:hypothetical protein